VTLTDSLPAGYTWSLGGANAASCSINTVPNPDVLSCNFGDLAAGASRTITLTTPTTGANCAAIPNLATVAASNEAPQQQGNNSDTGSINVRCANIAIAKVANPAGPISAGGTVGFDITVHNTGDGIATGVTVTDNLPAGIDWTLGAVTGDTTGVACAISGAVGSEKLACTDPSLGADGSFAVHVSGPSDAADCGTVSNTASVATTNDGSASATASVAVVCSALQIQKSFTGNTAGTDPDLDVPAANIGDTLHYSLAYTGSGPLHNSVITDTLPQGLAYVDGSAAGNADFNPGVYDSTTRTITWHAKGVLPDPASGTVTYDITVLDTAPDFAQPLVNLATIDSDETPVDQATASVAVLAPPLELTPPPVHVTPPPTSTLTPESAPSNPGFALMLMLFGIAGLALGIGFVTPTPERVRRRNRLG
jgi:uncharacterized repeat protein (TIGR01451 family)